MSDISDHDELTYITGTHVPPNKFHHPTNHEFTPHYVIIKAVKSATNRGLLSSETVATIAALVKSGVIFPYGNRKGWKEDLQGLNDAYYKASRYEASHEDVTPPTHYNVIDLLSTDTWFDNGLPSQRQKNFDRRRDLFDLDLALNSWQFPEPPQEVRVDPRDEHTSDSNTDNDNDNKIDDNEEEEIEKRGEGEDNSNDLFEPQEETVEISEDESIENKQNIPIRDMFKDSKYVKKSKIAEYENCFMDRLKKVIIYRSELIKNIARDKKLKTLKYSQVRGYFNAFNHRMLQFLVSFRVFFHLAPSSKKFGRLLHLSGEKLSETVVSNYAKQFKFLQDKKFIDNEGKRVKGFDSLDIIPKETFIFKSGKVRFVDKKRKRRDTPSEWDEMMRFNPKKKRKIYDIDEDEFIAKEDAPKTPPRPRKSNDSKLDEIIKNQNDLAFSVGILRSKTEKLTKSPQIQSVDDMLNSDKRGIERWSHEFHVNKTTLGFELIASETRQNQRNSSHQQLYQKMMNKKNKNRDIVSDIQGKWVCILSIM